MAEKQRGIVVKHPESNDRAIEPATTTADDLLLSVRPANDAGSWDATASTPWFPLQPRSLERWERLMRCPTHLEGHIVAGRLLADGIPARVELTPPGFDFTAASAVWVPTEAARRAQWLLAWAPPSDEELAALARSAP